MLVSGGAAPNVRDKKWGTPLQIATDKGDWECIDYLRSVGAKLIPPRPYPLSQIEVYDRWIHRWRRGHLSEVYIPPPPPPPPPPTPLVNAVFGGPDELVVEMLQKKRFNVNARDGYGRLALAVACSMGFVNRAKVRGAPCL